MGASGESVDEIASTLDAHARAETWERVARELGPAIQRLARGYEADADRQRDLAQEVMIAVWRALPSFEGRSSLRTWVYRIAHNVAVTHVMRGARDQLARCVPLEAIDDLRATANPEAQAESRDAVEQLAVLVRRLRPADRQLILLYLEGLDHAEIAEVTGLTPENVATRAHRIKAALSTALQKGGVHGTR